MKQSRVDSIMESVVNITIGLSINFIYPTIPDKKGF